MYSIWFLCLLVLIIGILMMSVSSKREHDGVSDSPVFFFGFVATIISLLGMCKAKGVNPIDVALSLYPEALLYFIIYLVIGAVYTLLVWRFEILANLKKNLDKIKNSPRYKDKNTWHSSGDIIKDIVSNNWSVYYIPEGENIILPKIGRFAPYLTWLSFFWITDAVRRIAGNLLTWILYDIPRIVGTAVYKAIKSRLEAISRQVFK